MQADEFGIEAPAWLLSQTETLIDRATCDEHRKAHFTHRLNQIRFRGELEALRGEIEACQPPRPVGGLPHPNDELSRRLAREP